MKSERTIKLKNVFRKKFRSALLNYNSLVYVAIKIFWLLQLLLLLIINEHVSSELFPLNIKREFFNRQFAEVPFEVNISFPNVIKC